LERAARRGRRNEKEKEEEEERKEKEVKRKKKLVLIDEEDEGDKGAFAERPTRKLKRTIRASLRRREKLREA
jgi:hypothetical protein